MLQFDALMEESLRAAVLELLTPDRQKEFLISSCSLTDKPHMQPGPGSTELRDASAMGPSRWSCQLFNNLCHLLTDLVQLRSSARVTDDHEHEEVSIWRLMCKFVSPNDEFTGGQVARVLILAVLTAFLSENCSFCGYKAKVCWFRTINNEILCASIFLAHFASSDVNNSVSDRLRPAAEERLIGRPWKCFHSECKLVLGVNQESLQPWKAAVDDCYNAILCTTADALSLEICPEGLKERVS